MSWDNKSSRKRSAAPSARPPQQTQAPTTFGLSLKTDSIDAAQLQRSSDPYNTSGSFDRTKNWARVRKR